MHREAGNMDIFRSKRKASWSSWGDKDYRGDTWLMTMPFCSHDLFLHGKDNILEDLFLERLFLRQADISQLQNLTPDTGIMNAYFSFPVFPHKRYHHAMMVAMMAAVLVKKMEIPWREAFTFVIAAAYHDAATVAGGDAIRCAFDTLCEERNFSECIKIHGLDLKWNSLGFDLSEAQLYVQGKGRYGQLLDHLDKVSYTLLDCHFFGANMPRVLKDFIDKNPLFGDIWSDVHFDAEGIYFSDVERLYAFAMVRSLMHVYLYKNPASRRIEHIVAKEIRRLLAQEIISFDDLKRESDSWLSQILEKHGCNIRSCMTPDIINWKRFARRDDCLRYAELLGERLVITEEIRRFNCGLSWRVASGEKKDSLENILSESKVRQLEDLASARSGWYVYFYQ